MLTRRDKPNPHGDDYHSRTDYALGGSDLPVPGVVSYTRAFIGLDYLLQ